MTTANSTSYLLLALIVVSYLVLGTLYALQTPKWQAPDEPAHFNYIEYVVQEGNLPVLQAGDYPYQYLEEIKAARFPSHMSISPIRYESHQPPLYYLLGAILNRLTSGLAFDLQFLALRLFSVLLGAMVLVTAYRLVRDIFPDTELLALVATAFVAVLPMHLAMTAAINNDTLAELLLLLILWQSVRAMQEGLATRRAIITGILLGLALLTKTTTYLIAVGTVVMAALLRREPEHGHPSTRALPKTRYLSYVFALALLLAAPWFVRNAMVYGDLDIFGWQRHEMVVAGQLRTADLLAQIGMISFVRQFVVTTFRSFWAQFGWMGVLVDERIYLTLALVSSILGVGFVVFVVRVRQGKVSLTQSQRRVLALLGGAALLTTLQYLGYNLTFVQHQGRYLFLALVPLALGAALSLREVLRPRTARLLAGLLLLVSLLLFAHGAVSGGMPRWSPALLIAGAAFLASAGWLPARWQWLPPGLLYAGSVTLDLICLFTYIIPCLR